MKNISIFAKSTGPDEMPHYASLHLCWDTEFLEVSTGSNLNAFCFSCVFINCTVKCIQRK